MLLRPETRLRPANRMQPGEVWHCRRRGGGSVPLIPASTVTMELTRCQVEQGTAARVQQGSCSCSISTANAESCCNTGKNIAGQGGKKIAGQGIESETSTNHASAKIATVISAASSRAAVSSPAQREEERTPCLLSSGLWSSRGPHCIHTNHRSATSPTGVGKVFRPEQCRGAAHRPISTPGTHWHRDFVRDRARYPEISPDCATPINRFPSGSWFGTQ